MPPKFLHENVYWEEGHPKHEYAGSLATSFGPSKKTIVINLAKEGLTVSVITILSKNRVSQSLDGERQNPPYNSLASNNLFSLHC